MNNRFKQFLPDTLDEETVLQPAAYLGEQPKVCCPKRGIIAGSGPRLTHETQALLRLRLRAAAFIALARIEGSSALPRLVDAMVDPSKDVRMAAAQAMGYVGTEAAGLLLRLKNRIGDRDPDVLSECLSGLLTVNPREYLGFVAESLTTDNAARCEAAALALGKSRLPDALGRRPNA